MLLEIQTQLKAGLLTAKFCKIPLIAHIPSKASKVNTILTCPHNGRGLHGVRLFHVAAQMDPFGQQRETIVPNEDLNQPASPHEETFHL